MFYSTLYSCVFLSVRLLPLCLLFTYALFSRAFQCSSVMHFYDTSEISFVLQPFANSHSFFSVAFRRSNVSICHFTSIFRATCIFHNIHKLKMFAHISCYFHRTIFDFLFILFDNVSDLHPYFFILWMYCFNIHSMTFFLFYTILCNNLSQFIFLFLFNFFCWQEEHHCIRNWKSVLR